MTAAARIYCDHNATSPMLPSARQAMITALDARHGNPSAIHREGAEARYLVERTRRRVARLVGAGADNEVILTSGGTAAANLAMLGAARAARRAGRGNHLVVSAGEHRAVLDAARWLADHEGFELTLAPLDGEGRVNLTALAGLLRPTTVLVAVMAASNETGALNDIAAVGDVVRSHGGAVVYTDACQCPGRVPLSTAGADLLSLSAHKSGGPPGAGALWVRPGTAIEPLLHGGGQERDLFPGTENVPVLAGWGAALESLPLADPGLREALWSAIGAVAPAARRLTPMAGCLPNTLLVLFPGRDGRAIVRALDARGVAASPGSACQSGGGSPSHVVLAMGVPRHQARGAVRFSLGWTNTREDIPRITAALAAALAEQPD
jgi:cysteine desulfurase